MNLEQKQWIDNASLAQLLDRWRHAEIGDPIFQFKAGLYYSDRMRELRSNDPQAWVSASKQVGW